jgi:hypothetical protein
MKHPSKRTIAEVVGGILLIGVGASSASGSSTTAAATPTPKVVVQTTTVPGPERTVEITASPQIVEVTASPQIIEKTVEKKVEVTPQACLDALDEADQGFTIASKGFDKVSEIVQAMSVLDVDTALEKIDELNDITGDMSALSGPYNADKAACRAAS